MAFTHDLNELPSPGSGTAHVLLSNGKPIAQTPQTRYNQCEVMYPHHKGHENRNVLTSCRQLQARRAVCWPSDNSKIVDRIGIPLENDFDDSCWQEKNAGKRQSQFRLKPRTLNFQGGSSSNKTQIGQLPFLQNGSIVLQYHPETPNGRLEGLLQLASVGSEEVIQHEQETVQRDKSSSTTRMSYLSKQPPSQDRQTLPFPHLEETAASPADDLSSWEPMLTPPPTTSRRRIPETVLRPKKRRRMTDSSWGERLFI